MRRLVRLYDALVTALAVLAGAAIALIFVLIVADVAARELFGKPFLATVGVVEYAMLYFTMFAAPYLMRTHGHVHVEALVSRLPPGGRRALEKGVGLVCAAACGLFAYTATQLLLEKLESGAIDMRSIDIPGWIIVAPLPLCYALVGVECLRFVFGRESMWRGGAPEAL